VKAPSAFGRRDKKLFRGFRTTEWFLSTNRSFERSGSFRFPEAIQRRRNPRSTVAFALRLKKFWVNAALSARTQSAHGIPSARRRPTQRRAVIPQPPEVHRSTEYSRRVGRSVERRSIARNVSSHTRTPAGESSRQKQTYEVALRFIRYYIHSASPLKALTAVSGTTIPRILPVVSASRIQIATRRETTFI